MGAEVRKNTKLYGGTGGRRPTEGQNEHATRHGCSDMEHAPCTMQHATCSTMQMQTHGHGTTTKLSKQLPNSYLKRQPTI